MGTLHATYYLDTHESRWDNIVDAFDRGCKLDHISLIADGP
jgi:hypothetical protein